MAWKVSGRSMELCSCRAFCPCWLGPEGQPDKGWCSGIFGFDIESGQSDGVDLSGLKVVFMAHWPGNFFAGNGKARLFIDETADPNQQKELEAIFGGKKGGPLEAVWGAVLDTWLPAQTGKVEMQWGDTSRVSVGDVGAAHLKPFGDGAGNSTTVTGAAAQAAFQYDSMILADGRDSKWSDSDLGDWTGDSATLHKFNWAA